MHVLMLLVTLHLFDGAVCPQPLNRGALSNQVHDLNAFANRRHLFLLDLPLDVQTRVGRLRPPPATKDRDMDDACTMSAHVVAIHDWIDLIDVNETFVADKYGRVKRWIAGQPGGTRNRGQIDRLLAESAAQIAANNLDKANGALQSAIFLLTGNTDPLSAPQWMKNVDQAFSEDEWTETPLSEIKLGCPAVAKKGSANSDDLQQALKRLGEVMDAGTLRSYDLKGGDKLLAKLRTYGELRLVGPATQMTCVMLARATRFEVNFTSVMQRYLRLGRMRDERGITDLIKKEFHERATHASEAIVAQDYKRAFRELEALAILLGESSPPSTILAGVAL